MRPAAVRRGRILDLLAQREYLTVGEAQAAAGASMATTQRDLTHLATTGALTRIRGGAMRSSSPARDERPLLVACLARAHRRSTPATWTSRPVPVRTLFRYSRN
jgi:DeoR/GlpR family transcriptional regulator of sugar metabolism